MTSDPDAGVGRPAPLIIFPYNGNGIEALDCLGSRFTLVTFVDDTPDKHGVSEGGHPVGPRALLARHSSAKVLAVPGSPVSYLKRSDIIGSLRVDVGRFAQVVHPAAQVSPSARLGHNVLLMAGVVVTSNAVIGNHVCVLPNTVIHHDVVIGDYSLIGSNVTIAGGTRVGRSCYIGSGASLMNGLTVADGALVGIGSTVIRDVLPGATVAGNPARQIAARPTRTQT